MLLALGMALATWFEVKLIKGSNGEQNLEERPNGIKRRQSEKGSHTSTGTSNGIS